MTYLIINGYELPYPKRGAAPTIVTLVNSARDGNGTIIGQRIGRDQYKIDNIVFPWLSAEEWSRILTILSNFFVYVTFPDPVTNKRTTIRMYCGNRTGTPYYVDDNGDPEHYTDCKFNLIDCGE